MTRRLIALGLIGLLTACSAGTSTDGAGSADDENGGPIVIDDLDDIPLDCREVLAGFLKDIEPTVERVDWDTATLADMQDITPVIDQMTIKFETGMEAVGCDDLAFGADDEQQFEIAVEIARKEAPGSERWLRFSRDMSTGLDSAAATVTDDPSALPADCDEAKAAVTELIGDADSVNEILVVDLVRITNAIATIETICTSSEAAAYFDDPDLQAFFSGQ
jgi:hypothetical protein